MEGDDRPLRPALPTPQAAASLGRHCELAQTIARLAGIRSNSRALRLGTYRQLHVASEQLVFEREYRGERVLVAINAAAPVQVEIQVAPHSNRVLQDELEPGKVFDLRRNRLRVALPAGGGRILIEREKAAEPS